MKSALERIQYNLLEKGYHCSQIMMQLSLEDRNLHAPFTIRALGGLGGGMFEQKTCGTLTGAVCMLSSYVKRGELEPEPTQYQPMVKELLCWFEEELGSTECHDLVDFNREAILAICPNLMAYTYQKCKEILADNGFDYDN